MPKNTVHMGPSDGPLDAPITHVEGKEVERIEFADGQTVINPEYTDDEKRNTDGTSPVGHARSVEGGASSPGKSSKESSTATDSSQPKSSNDSRDSARSTGRGSK